MSLSNVPDDWNSWYSKCSRCGNKYHDSEGGCGCLDDKTECRSCDEWTDDEDLDSHGECKSCVDDRACAECDTKENLVFNKEIDEWACEPCLVVILAEH